MTLLMSALRRRRLSPISSSTAFASAALFTRAFSNQPSSPERRPSFGIAFDIDGVLLLGNTPIGGAARALKRLYSSDGSLKIPFLFLTNGGGVPEPWRASELSKLLGVPISSLQVLLGHSPFKNLVSRFENDLIVAVGKGDPAAVMLQYGYKKVISMDKYSFGFEAIDPLAPYKTWKVKSSSNEGDASQKSASFDVLSDKVAGVFVVSDPIDWGRDIQVICDILTTGGLPGVKMSDRRPPLYFANDDLEYQSTFPSERLGMGAFRIALESILNRISKDPLAYTSFGKPNPLVFENAEGVLQQIVSSIYAGKVTKNEPQKHSFSTLYMIGDNPAVDIQGARKAGDPWYSILTRTGVFKEKDNHSHYPADLVVDTVEEAIEFILERERVSNN